ncbi:hypothetical protein Plhal304r1_c042g0122131 [Plasmopara halstedii]
MLLLKLYIMNVRRPKLNSLLCFRPHFVPRITCFFSLKRHRSLHSHVHTDHVE